MKRLFAGLAASLLIWAQPAAAQSILRDAETEAMFNDMSRPLILAAGLSPNNVRVVLINDDSINAFTAGGQTIYVNSGLIQAADNANQVQGVIAHELGHVADGHVVLIDAGARPAMGISILSMVLGIAAIAAGAPEAGAGILSAGTTAAEGKFLAFSRVQESTADATGAKFLRESGISGKGMLSFFKKLANEEYAYGLKNIDPFAQSHPLSGERIANLTADVTSSPFYNAKPDLALDDRFKRVKAKLLGYVADPKTTLNVYPEQDQSVYAHYARAYAWHKAGYPEKADAEAAALLKADPHDPYFLEIQGQILLEAGKPRQALAPLREATDLSRNAPLIATTFGHALIATEDRANYPEAIKVLRQAVARDDDNPFAWYQLGTAYEASGDQPRALLATAEQASLTGDHRTAAYSARGAMQGLPPNSVDWIRAQDIALSAQNEMDDNPKKYKKRR
ncbi:putative Zn-dependent protease [Sphingomonas sp. BE270]|jgi:predicted Zn-dependent protease|uniref:M48 family metalloprotease n=1 Tax=unclassified Sphingomonas TaxID=196159 RepID=UPI00053E8B61|nr:MULTISPECIES: M48 family metalloprotease [unclassified Sphingomonas]MDR6850029.1 putative Zn-dependent protease [Sphingomonas sp. BE137]MDR7260343.1 putative Zn-dependent protease [Sphingomonas sp. BE270]RUN75572.1 peptidase M48 [Sphingomonas sp. TF3]